METLKIGFGFIEIAAAIKFLWVPDMEWEIGLLPRDIVLWSFILIGALLVGYLVGLYRIGSAENIKPFALGKGRVVAVLITLMFLYPLGMSVASPPTYHYAKMPRLMDEFIEALVPPPPTEDDIAIKEGWFVDQYDEALAKAKAEKKLIKAEAEYDNAMKNLSLARTKPSGREIEKDTKKRVEVFINSGRLDVKERQSFSKWFFDMGLVINIDLYRGSFEIGIGRREKGVLVEMDRSVEDLSMINQKGYSLDLNHFDNQRRNQVLKAVPEGHQIITVAGLGDDKQPFFVSIMEDKRPPKRQKKTA